MSSSPAPQHEKPHVLVLGAGVVGLQTALALLQASYRVTVIAQYWPGDSSLDYTSPRAGGHWRSHASSSPADAALRGYETATYREWKRILDAPGHDAAETGLAYNRSECIGPGASGLWFQTLLPEFTASGEGDAAKAAFEAICFNPDVYLAYLLGRIGEQGVTTHTATLESLDEAFLLPGCEAAVALANCTGMGARSLVPDPAVFPTKGQTVLVRGETATIVYRERTGAYAIRRPGAGTVLGGSKDAGNWTEGLDPALRAKILEWGKEMVPELLGEDGEFDVLAETVGRRPSRKGGVRLEWEPLETDEGRKIVVHNYGHSGAGYQMSVGTAEEAVRLVEEALAKST